VPTANIRYGSFKGRATQYTYNEAWVFVDGVWHETESVFVLLGATRLTREAYLETFGHLPPLPKTAFDPDDPLRAGRIRYGHHDGPCVFNLHEAWWCYNGEWKPMSVTEAVCRAGLMTEAHYRRIYGDLPPLPPEAFRSGWRSPLV